MGNTQVPGRRAAGHPQGVRRRQRRTQVGPYGSVYRSISGSGKRSMSIRRGPPLNPITRGKSFRLRRSFSRAPVPRPPAGTAFLFLFWTVRGPFVPDLRAIASRRLASDTRPRAQSRFLLEEKTGAPAAT